MVELNRRLATPQLAEDLPGTLLMKVAMDYVRYLAERNAIEQAKLNQEKVDPLEMIDQPGLNLSMRVEILAEYLEEVEDYWTRASARMAELLEEVGDGEGEVVQDVPDMVPGE